MELNTMIEFKLTNELTAYYKVERVGQQFPDCSDDIVTLASIYLPTRFCDTIYILHRDITFESRLEIAKEFLNSDWGRESKDYNIKDYGNLRKNIRDFTHQKWAIAEAQAALWAINELWKLKKALINRQEALDNAELTDSQEFMKNEYYLENLF